MPRGRKKKFKLDLNLKSDTIRSVFALLFILMSLLSLISFFARDYAINAKVNGFLMGLFGYPSIIFALLLGILGLLLIPSLNLRIKQPRIIAGLAMFLFTLSAFIHLFVGSESSRELAEEGKGGGMVGHFISSFLINTVSIYGAVVILFIAVIIEIIIIFDFSIEQLMAFAKSVLEKLNLGSLAEKFKNKNGNSMGEMEVSSGSISADGISSYEEDRLSYASLPVEPSFEVIPTMSEPQKGDKQTLKVDTSGMGSVTPALPYSDRVWQLPPLDLLEEPKAYATDSPELYEERKKIIRETLRSFGIDVEVVDFKKGPTVTQFVLRSDSSGVRVSKIASLQTNLALALASPTGSVRIEAPIPGTSHIGIEVPNTKISTVYFKSLITSEPMKGLKSRLGITLGKDVGGRVYTYDIAKMPHLLIAGATGSGKSVFIHNILFSILYRATPQEVKFILVDPKRVELKHYEHIPHLLTPIVTDMEKAPSVFKWAVSEMERRYKLFEAAKARNIESYNEMSGFQALPYIVIIVDEFAEIMVLDPAGVEKSIIRIAQLARATGIHLILAVQRPSTEIITGIIKANIPCRVAFNVTSQIDSRVIIDQPGAEKLLGKGDMLFVPPDAAKPFRLQGAFLSDREIASTVEFLKSQGVAPDYKEEITAMNEKVQGRTSENWGEGVDALFDEAVEIVIMAGKASASLLQRKLSIGYARAARIIDELEMKGIIGKADGAKPRDLLIDRLPNDPLMQQNEVESLQDL